MNDISESETKLLSKPCKGRTCAHAQNHYLVEVTKTEGDLDGKISVGMRLVEHAKPPAKKEIFWMDDKPSARGKHELHFGKYWIQLVATVPIERAARAPSLKERARA